VEALADVIALIQSDIWLFLYSIFSAFDFFLIILTIQSTTITLATLLSDILSVIVLFYALCFPFYLVTRSLGVK
jgi:hypothetical protein